MLVGGFCGRLLWFKRIVGGDVGGNIVEASCSVSLMVLVICLWMVRNSSEVRMAVASLF